MTDVAVVITAAGSSTRIGAGIKKEYLPLKHGTVLSESARAFLKAVPVQFLVITHPEGRKTDAENALFSDREISNLSKNTKIVFTAGGKDRESSVFNALKTLAAAGFSPNGIVLVHDGARPFVSESVIVRVLESARAGGAAVPALEPVDTQKEISADKKIVRHLKRAHLAAVQTPQGFLFAPFFSAHKKAAENPLDFTDDTEIWDEFADSGRVTVVSGDAANTKLTFASDLERLKKQEAQVIHTGLGYDLHPLVEGRALVLGGVEIPSERGELGHSDGDALLHAITDALLGAAGLGDIGSYFPPEEPEWKDADSATLLQTVWRDVTAAGWSLVNLDAVVLLERPKFLPYRDSVRQSIARILGVAAETVFVKAKTGEKMGKIGRGEAVEVFASCLLQK